MYLLYRRFEVSVTFDHFVTPQILLRSLNMLYNIRALCCFVSEMSSNEAVDGEMRLELKGVEIPLSPQSRSINNAASHLTHSGKALPSANKQLYLKDSEPQF